MPLRLAISAEHFLLADTHSAAARASITSDIAGDGDRDDDVDDDGDGDVDDDGDEDEDDDGDEDVDDDGDGDGDVDDDGDSEDQDDGVGDDDGGDAADGEGGDAMETSGEFEDDSIVEGEGEGDMDAMGLGVHDAEADSDSEGEADVDTDVEAVDDILIVGDGFGVTENQGMISRQRLLMVQLRTQKLWPSAQFCLQNSQAIIRHSSSCW